MVLAMMVRFFLLGMVIIGMVISLLSGCQVKQQKKEVPPSTLSDAAVDTVSDNLVHRFEVEHADLFFPFSYQAHYFQQQEQPNGESYLIKLQVPTTVEKSLPEYRKQMEMYGWRLVMALPAYLLFEKPYARCIIIATQHLQGTAITMVYNTLRVDEAYSLV